MRTVASIRRRLVGFECKLFDATMANLVHVGNPLRLNGLCAAARELVRHVLERMASAEQVRACSWYRVLYAQGERVTRTQRITYAIQGGLATEFDVPPAFGRRQIGMGYAGVNVTPKWDTRHGRLSPAYTTNWDQLLVVERNLAGCSAYGMSLSSVIGYIYSSAKG